MSKTDKNTKLNQELSNKSLTELVQLEGLQALTTNITSLTISAIPEKYRNDTEQWDIKIERRGKGTYAVLWRNRTYSKKDGWEYESQPSSRTKKYIKNSRYSLAEAVKIAEELSRTVEFFHYTAVDYTWAQINRDTYNELNPDKHVNLRHEMSWQAANENGEIQRELAYYAYVDTLPDVPETVKENMEFRRKKYLEEIAGVTNAN